MIPLLKNFWHELMYSPERVRVWFRGFLGWAAAAGAQVVTAGPEAVMTWTAKDWTIRMLVAGVAGFALLLKAGEKNAPSAPPAG